METCPHCGTRLPMVVDAYCPECREDLSLRPEELNRVANSEEVAPTGYQTAPNAALAAAGAATHRLLYLWGFVMTLSFAVGGIIAALQGEWGAVLGAWVIGSCMGAWAWTHYQRVGVTASITGQEKTRPNEDKPK